VKDFIHASKNLTNHILEKVTQKNPVSRENVMETLG